MRRAPGTRDKLALTMRYVGMEARRLQDLAKPGSKVELLEPWDGAVKCAQNAKATRHELLG